MYIFESFLWLREREEKNTREKKECMNGFIKGEMRTQYNGLLQYLVVAGRKKYIEMGICSFAMMCFFFAYSYSFFFFIPVDSVLSTSNVYIFFSRFRRRFLFPILILYSFKS